MDLYNLLCAVLSAGKGFEKVYVPDIWDLPFPVLLEIFIPL